MPILESRTQHWPDEAACARAGAALAGHAASIRDASIELHGPLGAGKTTFARHLLHALGVEGRIKSPTYALVELHEAGDEADGFEIFHFDFYRFDDPQEWEDAGFRDIYAGPGLKLAEWPEKAAGLLPVADLVISIEPEDGEDETVPRNVRFDALTPRGRELLG